MGNRMKLAIILLWVGVLVAGCFETKKGVEEPSGQTYKYICIDNVRYILVNQGVSVMFNADGTVKTCK